MKHAKLTLAGLVTAALILAAAVPAPAKELVNEARSVISGIQKRSSTLSGELSEFHQEFSRRAARMVELEADLEDLKKKGYIGEKYAQDPEKYERIYAEHAESVVELKDLFLAYAPRIQRAVSDFNKSIYYGKDRIVQLRSDDMATAETELARAKENFVRIQEQRAELEANCPSTAEPSRACRRARINYQRKLTRLKQSLTRLQYLRRVSHLKNSIVGKLNEIMDRYVYKEADTVDMLVNYAFNFEQYGDFIGSKDLGGMLQTVRELRDLEQKMRDFEQFQSGLSVHVADLGNLVDQRLDHFMDKTGMGQVESRDEVLSGFEDQEREIADMIRQLEQQV